MGLSKQLLDYLFSTTPDYRIVQFNCKPILKYFHAPQFNDEPEVLALQLNNSTKIFYKRNIGIEYRIYIKKRKGYGHL
jgi:hypothetical protein